MGKITIDVDDSLDIEVGIAAAKQDVNKDKSSEDVASEIENIILKIGEMTRLTNDIKQLDPGPVQEALQKKAEDLLINVIEDTSSSN